MKAGSLLDNEKGYASLLMVFAIGAVVAMMTLHISSAFIKVQKQYELKKVKENQHYAFQALSQLVKQAFYIAEMDPTCASAGSTFVKRDLPGGGALCVDPSEGLCYSDQEKLGTNQPICISVESNQLSWDYSGGTTVSVYKFGPAAQGSPSKGNLTQTTSFTIPDTSNSDVWRSCSGSSSCVRLLLCPLGQKVCDLSNAEAMQVVRLGSL